MLNPGPGFVAMTVLTLTAGTAFIMWLGEQITDRGIGNGMSLLIFAGIVDGSAARHRGAVREGQDADLRCLHRSRAGSCWSWA